MSTDPDTRHSPYDCVIVGGGLIGSSLARALIPTGLRVALVEAVPAETQSQPSYDERVIALSWGSRRILEAMGSWGAIEPEAAPIEQVHISDRGRFGFTRLDTAGLGVPALGYVVPARTLGAALRRATELPTQSAIDIISPARLTGHRKVEHGLELDLSTPQGTSRLHTRLLVAADGGDSEIRKGLGIRVDEWRYGHDAVIATISPELPRPGVAFERFTGTGPLAMLPLTGGRYSVVWTSRESETADILSLSDGEFLQRLQRRFGQRLGRLEQPSTRRAYPLKLMLAHEDTRPRLVLIGNAAHTLHPVAGQGFNLGLRDVAALAEVLAQSKAQGRDPGGADVLAGYSHWRGKDQATVARVTDALARLFVNPWAPLRLARDAGLLGLDLLPGAKRLVAQRFMGTGGRLPRLARGLPLHPAQTPEHA